MILAEIKRFFKEEDGMAVVEIILIVVVLVALVALFKTQISTLVTSLLTKVSTAAGKI